jgi:hypothetical protein
MKELIGLMASEVARRVADELRETEIVPLNKRVNSLEMKMVQPSKTSQENSLTLAHYKGVFDGLWKAGVIVIALVQLLHYGRNLLHL